jgi:U1 small nuclear ribonucleoprotein C
MPKYFCEYCGIYLTHSSPGGRKQHSHGRKHINNKIEYYSQFLYEFQQNTYNNMMTMATKMPIPANQQGASQFNQFMNPNQQMMNFPRMIQPNMMMRPGIQLVNPASMVNQNMQNANNYT